MFQYLVWLIPGFLFYTRFHQIHYSKRPNGWQLILSVSVSSLLIFLLSLLLYQPIKAMTDCVIETFGFIDKREIYKIFRVLFSLDYVESNDSINRISEAHAFIYKHLPAAFILSLMYYIIATVALHWNYGPAIWIQKT